MILQWKILHSCLLQTGDVPGPCISTAIIQECTASKFSGYFKSSRSKEADFGEDVGWLQVQLLLLRMVAPSKY